MKVGKLPPLPASVAFDNHAEFPRMICRCQAETDNDSKVLISCLFQITYHYCLFDTSLGMDG